MDTFWVLFFFTIKINCFYSFSPLFIKASKNCMIPKKGRIISRQRYYQIYYKRPFFDETWKKCHGIKNSSMSTRCKSLSNGLFHCGESKISIRSGFVWIFIDIFRALKLNWWVEKSQSIIPYRYDLFIIISSIISYSEHIYFSFTEWWLLHVSSGWFEWWNWYWWSCVMNQDFEKEIDPLKCLQNLIDDWTKISIVIDIRKMCIRSKPQTKLMFEIRSLHCSGWMSSSSILKHRKPNIRTE